jgi:hypothetical protein
MRGIGIIFLFQCLLAYGQLDINECPKFLVKDKRFLREAVFRSDSTLTLHVDDNVTGSLEINNAGLYKAVNFDFVFKAKGGGAAPFIGDLLIIYFRDHTKDEVFVRSRKVYAGKASFAIVRQTDTRFGTALTNEDAVFFEKMKMITISHLEMTIGSEKHKIRLNARQADWLRSVITCIGALKPY